MNMNLDSLNKWVSLLANIGVVLGFVVVAYQLNLNTESLRASSSYQRSDLATNAEVAMIGDTGYAAYAKSMVNPAGLTQAEMIQVWAYFSIAQVSAVQAYMDYESGRITDADWDFSRQSFASYFNYPLGRIWWEETVKAMTFSGNTAFFDAVQEVLDQSPENATSTWFLEMNRRAGEL